MFIEDGRKVTGIKTITTKDGDRSWRFQHANSEPKAATDDKHTELLQQNALDKINRLQIGKDLTEGERDAMRMHSSCPHPAVLVAMTGKRNTFRDASD